MLSTLKSRSKTKFKLPAQLDHHTAQTICREIQKRMVDGHLQLQADASAVKHVDSFGIGFLVKALKSVRSLGGDLTIVNLKDSILELFVDVGLDKIFSLDPELAPVSRPQPETIDSLEAEPDIRYQLVQKIGLFRISGMMLFPAGVREFNWKALDAMRSTNKFVLDLKNLSYMDSSAVGEVLAINTLLKTSKGEIRVCRLRKNIAELFQALGLDTVLKVYDGLEEAMNSWF